MVNRFAFNKALILAAMFFACAIVPAMAQDATDVSSHPMIGEMAPAFTLAQVGGETLSLASLRGKYIVIHFGASW